MNRLQQSDIFIALGGNIGDVQASFASAYLALQAHCTILHRSKLYQTPALTTDNSTTPQADYLNAVVQVDSDLSASDLLAFLHRIEDQHGRERKQHWGARTLDLDLLTYNQQISATPKLQLPHHQLEKRLFVLQPMADIKPTWIHPVTQQPISAMIQHLIKNNDDLYEGKLWTINPIK